MTLDALRIGSASARRNGSDASAPPASTTSRRGQRRGAQDDVVDAEEQYETYEWAGETRIRATSLLQGNFSGMEGVQ